MSHSNNRRLQRSAMVAALVLLSPQLARAQQSGYDGVYKPNEIDVRRCVDTLQVGSLTRVTVFQRAVLRDTTAAVRAEVDLVAQRIAAAARSALGASGDAVPDADSLGIWLRGDGRLPLVVVLHREQPGSWRPDTTSDTLSAKVTSLYTAVLRSIPPDSLWMVWPDAYGADSIAFRMTLVAEPVGRSFVASNSSMFAVYRTQGVLEQPALVKQHQVSPRYPYDAEMHRISGEVLLAFVVTAEGRADASTIRVLRPSAEVLRTSPFAHYYAEFVQAAKEALWNMRFYPARIGTCRVREEVQFPFLFAAP